MTVQAAAVLGGLKNALDTSASAPLPAAGSHVPAPTVERTEFVAPVLENAAATVPILDL